MAKRGNTEQFVVFSTQDPEVFTNKIHEFQGSLTEAKAYAQAHSFGGGVRIATRVNGKITYTQA